MAPTLDAASAEMLTERAPSELPPSRSSAAPAPGRRRRSRAAREALRQLAEGVHAITAPASSTATSSRRT